MKIKYYKLGVFFLIAGIIAAFSGCKKNELPPSVKRNPVLFVSGKFMGMKFDIQVDDTAFVASQYNIINPSSNARLFSFQFSATDPDHYTTCWFQFVNYKAPFGSLNSDIDSTFKPGYKELSNYFPSQSNPFNLNTMNFSITSNMGGYTSEKFTPDSSFVKIDSVSDITWNDGINYKLIYLSISANLRNNNIFDSTGIYPFTDGHACIAFPKD